MNIVDTAFSLHNKNILVTGASSGIGKAISILAAQFGANIILTGRDKERLAQTQEKMDNNNHQIIPCDLLKDEEVQKIIYNIKTLDGIVHCAGKVSPYPIKYLSKIHINDIWKINYEVPVLLTGNLLKAKKLNNRASIVFISSIASQFPYKGGAAYAGAKAGINAFSKTLALELAAKHIRSNVILSAMVQTPLFDQVEKNIILTEMEQYKQRYPLGLGEAQDIAHATVFLLSNASKWITGTELVMDGGLTAGQ